MSMTSSEKAGADVEASEMARACGEKMLGSDKVAAGYGIKLDSISPDQAVLTMMVRADMLNIVGNCHGGITYTR